MIKIIQRTIDNKYLHSIENEEWVDSPNQALEMSILEFEDIKKNLSSTYPENHLKVITNFFKIKILSKEDQKEIREKILQKNKEQ